MVELTSSVRPRASLPTLGRDIVVCAATAILITFFALFSVHSTSPPATVSADATLSEFSSGRAMEQLRVIARSPHPIGSLEHMAVRDYILREIAAHGFEPSVQKTTAVNRHWGGIMHAGTVQNLLARLEGTGEGKAVLLVAHYDSWPAAFGASDDGAGVVTLLETLRALKTGPPLKNDVIFLFTDGEESGLLGANAFADEHPWVAEVGLVLNFEARGSRGPSIMFETSEHNGWLIREFAKVAPRPVSHSLAYEIYKLLPNDTDLTVFRKKGLVGLNFAYIEGLPSYHTQLDSVDEIDERSLQHHGSYALALTRHFGNLDLRETKESDAVYFDLFGATLIHYPVTWALPLAAFVAALFGVLVAYGLRRARLSLKGLVVGVLALALSAIVAAGLTTLIWGLIYRLDYGSDTSLQGQTYHSDLYLLGFAALTVALTSAVYVLLRKKIGVENLTSGALFWWSILMILVCVYMPGASYLFTWPLLFMLAPLWLMLKGRASEYVSSWEQPSTGLLIVLWLCGLPGLVLVTPLLYHVFIGLTLDYVWVVVMLLVLLLGLLVPHLSLVARPYRWLLPGAAAVACIGLLLTGVIRPDFDAAHPKPNSIFYGLDANAGTAIWASMDREPDEWSARFLSAQPQSKPLPAFFSATDPFTYLQTAAPVVPLDAPHVELLDDRTNDGVRTLHMRVTSPRQANELTLFLDSKVEVLRASVNGNLIDGSNTPALKSFADNWILCYFAVPPEGIDLKAEVRTSEPLKVRVVDLSYGLTKMQGAPSMDRPDGVIPASMPANNSTLVSKSFVF